MASRLLLPRGMWISTIVVLLTAELNESNTKPVLRTSFLLFFRNVQLHDLFRGVSDEQHGSRSQSGRKWSEVHGRCHSHPVDTDWHGSLALFAGADHKRSSNCCTTKWLRRCNIC